MELKTKGKDGSEGKAIERGAFAKAKEKYAVAIAAAALTAVAGCGGRTGIYDPSPCSCDSGCPASVDGGADNGPKQDAGPQHDAGPDADGGVPPQTVLWQGSNLIGDYLNRQLGDRKPNTDPNGSESAYPIGGSDTNQNANPFTDGNGGTIGPVETFMYKIDGSQLAEFNPQTLVDNDAALVYVEGQAMWLKGDNHFSSIAGNVVGKLSFLAYTMQFGGPAGADTGIPVCTHDSSGVSDYTSCKSAAGSLDDATETHRVRIKFLGEEWIVSEMNAPTGLSLADENKLVNGGSIKIAKEAVSGILNVGESLPVDNLKFQLDDIESDVNGKAAIISILDSNGNILKKDIVTEGQTKEFNVNGKTYSFHCYKVAPGYTSGAKWADVAIFSEELELRDGQALDSDNGLNNGFVVALGWKNRSASVQSVAPDSLRLIGVYSDDISKLSSSGDDLLNVGDYVPLVKDPTKWKLMYSGLDLQPSDRVSLKFEIKTADLAIPSNEGLTMQGNVVACTLHAPYVLVSSGASGAVFSANAQEVPSPSTLSDNAFIYPMENLACVDGNGNSYGVPSGSILMKESPNSSNYRLGEAIVNYQAIGASPSGFIVPDKYGVYSNILSSAGASCANDNCVDLNGSKSGVPDYYFVISEKTGEGSSDKFSDYFIFGIDKAKTGNPADATFSFKSSDGNGFQITDQNKVLYGHAVSNFNWYSGPEQSGPVASKTELVSPGYVSERGSTLVSVSDGEVRLNMAHKLAKAVWKLIGGQ